MKNTMRFLVVVVVLLGLGSGLAWAQSAQVEKVDIRAIKSIQIVPESNAFTAVVVIHISNDNDVAVQFRRPQFKVFLREDMTAGKTVEIGTASPEVIELKSTKNNAPMNEITLKVHMGPQNARTQERFINILNIVGNPANPVGMLMEGTGEVGAEERRGWVYQSGVKASLRFKPNVQREVLFE